MPPEPDPPAAADSGELSRRVDALYQGSLSGFVKRRNALAKQLREQGDKAAAQSVKALQKPSLGAWAVNQLWWSQPEPFEELLSAGARLRALLQSGDGDAHERAAAAAARKRALQALVRAAEGLLQEHGHAASAAVMRRITTSLEALAARGHADIDPPPGQLSADLEPPGFDLLASMGEVNPFAMLSPALPGAGMQRQATPRAHPELEGERAVAEQALRRVREVARSAAQALERAAKAHEEAQARAERARDSDRRAREELGEARRRADEAAASLRSAEQMRADAQGEVERLRAEVQRAEDEVRRAEEAVRGG